MFIIDLFLHFKTNRLESNKWLSIYSSNYFAIFLYSSIMFFEVAMQVF